MLDATALTTAAHEHSDTRSVLRRWQEDSADVLTTAAALIEVLRGHPRDAHIHRLFASLSIRVVDVTALVDDDVMVLDIAA